MEAEETQTVTLSLEDNVGSPERPRHCNSQRRVREKRSYRDLAPDIWRGSLLSLELNIDQCMHIWKYLGQGEKQSRRRREITKVLTPGWDLFAFQFIVPPVRIRKFCNPWWKLRRVLSQLLHKIRLKATLVLPLNKRLKARISALKDQMLLNNLYLCPRMKFKVICRNTERSSSPKRNTYYVCDVLEILPGMKKQQENSTTTRKKTSQLKLMKE